MNHNSTVFLTGLFAAVAAYNQACVEPIDASASLSMQNQEILRVLGSDVLLPQLEIVQENLSDLHRSLTSYQAQPSEENRILAQTDWKKVMKAWQHIEPIQFGPAGSSTNFVAGEDLRDPRGAAP